MRQAYRPPRFDAHIDLDLSKNEGVATITEIGIGPEELAALTSRYPDTTVLTEVVAARHGVPINRVLVTAGGDDALLRCFLAAAGRSVVATTPAFEMIRRYAAQAETPLIEFPWWDDDFPVDDFLDEVATGPALAVVVSPNNPTGSVLAPAALHKLADAYPLVVLDAAYAEFADEDLTPIALERDNVVVLRTLSKAFGLAGLRVGYAVGPERVIADLATFGSPYSLSSLSAALATRVLSEGMGAAEAFARSISVRRERLVALLEELGCSPLPSQGNFVLASDVDPDWTVAAAAALGVGLRRYDDRPELSTCVRITVPGDDASYNRLEETLRATLAPEAILFDMDGVLADVSRSYRSAIVATARRFGVEVSPGDVAAAKGRGDAADDWELTRSLCARSGVDVTFDEVREVFETIYQGDGQTEGLKLTERPLIDAGALERMAERLPLGVVTARPRRDAVEFLERFEIGGLFATMVTREDAPPKPDPAPVRLALERLGVARAWMIGDTVDDLAAARGAGVVPIALLVAGDDPGALSAAARILRSPDEIEEVLDAAKI